MHDVAGTCGYLCREGSLRPAPRSAAAAPVCQLALLIMPAPTVTPVASSMRMNEPVVRFFE